MTEKELYIEAAKKLVSFIVKNNFHEKQVGVNIKVQSPLFTCFYDAICTLYYYFYVYTVRILYFYCYIYSICILSFYFYSIRIFLFILTFISQTKTSCMRKRSAWSRDLTLLYFPFDRTIPCLEH